MRKFVRTAPIASTMARGRPRSRRGTCGSAAPRLPFRRGAGRSSFFVAVVVLVVASLAPAVPLFAAESANSFLAVPESVVRGNAFRVVTERPGAVALTTEEGGEIARTSAFPFTLTRDIHVGVALLGAPSTLAEGTYEIRLMNADGEVEAQEGLLVGDREFLRETIALNRNLTELRQDPDPRKTEEALELVDLVARVNPDAIYSDGSFDLPVEESRETSFFGDRRTFAYADGANADAIHYGLDLAAPTGTPVRTAAPGRVAFAGDRIVGGGSVVIEHLPGVYGLYYHLHSVDVDVGDRLGRGDLIGTLGATGLATGPHLHWEIRVAGVPVEPKELLEGALLDRPTIYQDIFEKNTAEGR
ncbi:MAG: M23 family metallopeptidase [bacterium]